MKMSGPLALAAVLLVRASEPSYEGAWFYLLLTVLSLGAGVLYLRSVDRRPGEDLSPRTARLLLLLALGLGAALRIHGIDFGLPHAYHPDEFRKINTLAKMLGRGDLDPERYFLHPPLLLYCSYFVARLLAWLTTLPPRATETLLLAGRTVSCFAGVVTIGLVYLLGREVWDRRTGAYAALVLAVLPLHVTCSRYMKEDVLFTMFLVASSWCLVRYHRSARWRELCSAAVCVGASIASKYTGLVALLPLAAVPLLRTLPLPWSGRARVVCQVVLAVLISVAVFFVLAPYSWWRFDRFVGGFAAESAHAASGHHGVKILPWPNLWMFHLSRSLLPGMGALPLFVSVAVAAAIVVRRQTTELLLLFTAALFYGIAELSPTKPFPQPERYVIPCVPYLAIFVGVALAQVRSLRPQLIATVLVLAMPLYRTLALAREIRPDTRQLTRIWMTEELPRGSRILTTGGSVYLPRFAHGLFKIVPHGKVLPKGSELISALRASGYRYLLVARFDSPYLRDVLDEEDRKREAAGIPAPRTDIDQLRDAFPVRFEARAAHGSYAFHNPVLTLFELAPDRTDVNNSEQK